MGEDLKVLLAQKRRKPSELAEFLGVSRSTISHWLAGTPIPNKYHANIALFLEEQSPLEKALKCLPENDARSIYEIILPMTKDQKINVIQFILGTL